MALSAGFHVGAHWSLLKLIGASLHLLQLPDQDIVCMVTLLVGVAIPSKNCTLQHQSNQKQSTPTGNVADNLKVAISVLCLVVRLLT